MNSTDTQATTRVTDPLDSLLSLEEQYYTEGYALGLSDGSTAGRIEGRTFGLEKGFEKFAEIGRLSGRAAVWQSRLGEPSTAAEAKQEAELSVTSLSGSDRLRRHVSKLVELTDDSDMATENNEDAVAELDDRLREAKSKSTLISRIIGEDGAEGRSGKHEESAAAPQGIPKSGEMEDFRGLARVKPMERDS